MDVVAVLVLTILALLSVFQLVVAFGSPIGHFAWGGQHKVLPKNLRIGSALAIIIYGIFGTFIVSKAGFWNIITNETVLNAGLWAIFAYFVIGVIMNGISRSKPERYTMTPLCIVLATCLFIMATS